MNWDQMEGKWLQMKGSVKQRFGKLTDDDLQVISGSRDKFVGKLQERYGIAKEEAQKRVDEWAQSLAEGQGQNQPQGQGQGQGQNQGQGQGQDKPKTYSGKP